MLSGVAAAFDRIGEAYDAAFADREAQVQWPFSSVTCSKRCALAVLTAAVAAEGESEAGLVNKFFPDLLQPEG